MRQLILYSPVTKIFEKNIKTLDAYNALILTPTRDARWYLSMSICGGIKCLGTIGS